MFVFQSAYRYEKDEKYFFVFYNDLSHANIISTDYSKRSGERQQR